MQKLKELIENHARWSALDVFVMRIEGNRDADFSTALENAKSLLESIGKEICKECGQQLEPNSSINGILKKSFAAIGYSNSDIVNKISRSLATIGEEIGKLRNNIGITGHGRTMDEIRQRNAKIDAFTKAFLFDSICAIAIFLIQVFEDRHTPQQNVEREPEYHDYEEFNEHWDEIFGEFAMGEYSYTASEILFAVDQDAYKSEYQAYQRDQLTSDIYADEYVHSAKDGGE